MKPIEEVRKICGHYWNNPNYIKSSVMSEHRCSHQHGMARCADCFNECPLYDLIKKSKVITL